MDYASLVHRVRELVWEHVPAGSNVAVVSKGDPALLLFDQRHGWHYPQTASGQYLGHHPETDAAAVAHLEALRQRGAQYLVIPAPYGWFLDFYTDLTRHLNREGEVIHRDEHCTIFALARRESRNVPTRTAVERQLRDLVAAVLPPGCRIVAVGWSHAALGGSADFQVVQGPAGDGDGGPEMSGILDLVRGCGAQYLVVPATSPGQSRTESRLIDDFRASWRTVLDHRHVCAVFAPPPPPKAGKR